MNQEQVLLTNSERIRGLIIIDVHHEINNIQLPVGAGETHNDEDLIKFFAFKSIYQIFIYKKCLMGSLTAH